MYVQIFRFSKPSTNTKPQTLQMPKGEATDVRWADKYANSGSPLKPAELQVLRAQFEKEGDYVGVQTKFNYAWVWRDGFEDAGQHG